MKKRIPYVTAFLMQVGSLVLCPLFYVFVKEITTIVFLIIFYVLWIVDFLILVFSYFKWWNIPIIITEEGIITKNKFLYSWKNASNVKYIAKAPTVYGPIHIRIIIEYSDGKRISFEPSKPLCKDICRMCKDEEILRKFYACYDGFKEDYSKDKKSKE